MHSENHCTSQSLLRTTHQLESVRQPRQNTPSIETPKFKNPDPMLQLIQHHLTLLHASSWVMTTLALLTSLILMFGFHAVCRCTISDAQEARIPGITMTARVDIFTKAVTSNPQSAQPKCPKQISDAATRAQT